MDSAYLKNKWVLGLRLCFYIALWVFELAIIVHRWADWPVSHRAVGVVVIVVLPVLIAYQARGLYRLIGDPARTPR